MTESLHEELFVEPKSNASLKVLAAISALIITVLLFVGYTYLRRRHAEQAAASLPQPVTETRREPQALVLVDDAMLKGGTTTLGGTVKNTSAAKLSGLTVELELKRRKDGVAEKKLVTLEPSELEPQQEGRYSIQLKAQDYGSARLAALRAGPESAPLPYLTGQGQKRIPERLESKTITIEGKRSGKKDEFLNSPDNPARVP
ncbi:MAG TPA: hypothetical protein VGW36_02020 [Pyrinomonadaceae bacterium]|nr:hypothetical protein [Pyrinomonadaceae bacterium]